MIYNTKHGNDLLGIFDAVFSNMEDIWAMPSSANIYSCQFPPLNVYLNEKTKDLKFEFALAGFDKDEIGLEFEGDYLKLSVIPKTDTKEDDEFVLLQKGIKRSSIEKEFYVPNAKYLVDKIKVKFEGGILEVTIPAKDEIKPRKLLIK